MIRDPGPLHNIGNGVTSRDVPATDGVTEGDAPNSGFISRAVNGHPIMRFVATTATTMAVAGVLSKLTKEGGLKLAKYAEDSIRETKSENVFSRLIGAGKQLRQHFDELEGVSRFIEGEADPYSKLVFEQEGKLTTGYDGIKSQRPFAITQNERDLAAAGKLGNEPEILRNYKDELQQRLVAAGRKLPYELPAFYIGQKAVVDPLFGNRKQEDRKVKWYNPFDVISDFTKESVKTTFGMVLPFAASGAAVSTAKSSLETLENSLSDIHSLTPMQQKMHKSFVNVSDVLAEVGHDFAGITDKFLKKSAQVSIGFDSAAQEFKTHQQGFVASLNDLKGGLQAARDKATNQALSRQELRSMQFNTLFKGTHTKEGTSVFDLIPSFRGTAAAFRAGKGEFKNVGRAYGAVDNALEFNKLIKDKQGLFGDNTEKLQQTINKIKGLHSSRLSELAHSVRVLGGGGPGEGQASRGAMYQGMQRDGFRDLIESQMVKRGVDPKQARLFSSHLKINELPKVDSDLTNIVTIGKTKINSPDHYQEILNRFRGIQKGKFTTLPGHPEFDANALEQSLHDAKAVFTSREFQLRIDNKVKNSWNKFYRDDLFNSADGILKPKKLSYHDFNGHQTAAKLEYLQRKTAQTIGVKLTEADGTIKSNDLIKKALGQRGFDPNRFEDLRSFLVKNKQLSSGIFKHNFNLFGLEQLSIDEARQRGMFSHIRDDEQKIIGDIAGRMAINDPVSESIGLSRLDGVYKTKKGDILDFTAIKSTFARASHFFASEFKIPLLGFNPTDLFGYNSFNEMSKRSPLQFISSRSVQPFLDAEGAKPDFYIWSRSKGLKGNLTSFHTDDQTGHIISSVLPGKYRAIPTSSSDLISRHARFAAGVTGESTDEIRGGIRSRFLKKVFGGDEVAVNRFKNRFSIDSDQPNSLFGQIERFRNRRFDPNNPVAMARLLSGEEVAAKRGSEKLSLKFGEVVRNGESEYGLIDQHGRQFEGVTQEHILRGFEHLQAVSNRYGMPAQVMERLEQSHPEIFTVNGRGISGVHSESEAIAFAKDLEARQSTVARDLRASGIEPSPVLSSFSRIRNLIEQSNLSGASSMAQHSPTITTRLDELKNEIFRYISQTNQIGMTNSPNEMFVQIQNAVDELVRSGAISSSQKAEAQAAGFSTLLNINAFKTFRRSSENITNLKNFVDSVQNATSTPEVKKLFDPFSRGEIAQVSGSIRKRFSPILSAVRRSTGTAPYLSDSLSIDPLGSGQNTTLLPTFGTVFKKNPLGAIKNAVGLTTYSDPSTFSASSIPMSQGVERLNRYFGTLGMQLDVSKFKGPLDLFARGMVGKRVLPMYAAGVTALTADRMLGGMINKKDQNGDRVYSPFVTTKVARLGVEGSALAAGLIPGGMDYASKKEQLVDGEVPIRQGRFWPLGNTPFKGGKIMYYRPSWYRKLQAGAMFTSDTYGSPAEKFLFYNDISPLRPLDPYRFERKHYEDRPYPVSGEYFSGPFGPLVPLANATIGKVLKPQMRMHKEEVAAGLAAYAPAGQSGAYDATAFSQPSYGGTGYGGPGNGFVGYGGGGGGVGSGTGFGGGGMQSGTNRMLASRAGSVGLARGMTRKSLSDVNSNYLAYSYGSPKVSQVMNPRIVGAGSPIKSGSTQFLAGEAGYRIQEMAGIYGFAAGNLREKFGFGQANLEPQRAVLQSASKGYGTTRAFWDLNLGGLGDVPLSGMGGVGNLEFSEIARRFMPKERSGVDYLNPIANKMGKEYSFLPGSEYYINFKTGDPFTKVQEGELRLPGKGYERLHTLHPDASGRYGLIDQLNILGDVAPYSNQYKAINAKINKMDLDVSQKAEVENIRKKVEDITRKEDFSEYKYKYESLSQVADRPAHYGLNRVGEYLAHSDNFILSKTIGKRSALEDWERTNVYGTTFPQWQKPIKSYLEPMVQKATQRNPLIASATLAAAGGLFGRTPRAKLFGSAIGAATGLLASSAAKTSEAITGERYIPGERKKELALEEYSDILTYTKNIRLAAMSQHSGDMKAAAQYTAAAKRTMYGADIYSNNVESLSLAIPKRKREHFKALINAPVEERSKILSTSGRLERRMYEAAWGMDVEKLPDLTDYFTRHELPGQDWEGWNPNTSMDYVKIKTGQHMGLDMSQMGYYPQQIKEANLVNPSFPGFAASEDRGDVAAKLKSLMSGMGVTGTVTPVMNPYGSTGINIMAGMR